MRKTRRPVACFKEDVPLCVWTGLDPIEELLSLDDPDNPESLAVVRFSTGLHSAWLEDGYIYCNQEFGGWEQRLHVVDARDPRQPELVYSFGAEGPPAIDILGPHNPMARDGLLYWAYYDAGLRVFDLTAPAEPLQVVEECATSDADVDVDVVERSDFT